MATLNCIILAASLGAMAVLHPMTPAAVTTGQPDGWALVLAGLIGVCVIARRRSAALAHRGLEVSPLAPPSAADRPPGQRGARAARTMAMPDGRTGQRHRGLYLTCVALLMVMPTRAAEQSTVTPFLEEKLTTDDNVFRLAKDVNAQQVIGSASLADTYRTTSAGLAVDAALRLQHLVASLTFNQSRYNRFSALDFNGRDLRASWLWQAGSAQHGELGISDTYTLASFAQVLGTKPDRLEVRQAFANGNFMLTPRWRLRGAVDRLEQYNSDPVQLVNDVNIDGAETAVSLVSGAGNTVGPFVRVERGWFPHPEPLGATLVDNGYRQYNAGVALDWTISPASHLLARGAQMSRHYQQLPQRDFDGQLGRVEYTWTPPGKLSLTAFAQRDVNPYELIHSSLVLVRGIGLRPAMRITTTLDLTADLEAATRRYLADPAQLLTLSAVRADRVRSAALQVSYHPSSRVAVQASLTHEDRSSNVAFGDYTAQVAWLSARLTL
jgi:exopolysaccharide biosynthesis operon protein EpsL